MEKVSALLADGTVFVGIIDRQQARAQRLYQF
jgi:hypothetical protein